MNEEMARKTAMSPSEVRDAMTAAFKRTMFGPADNSDMSWLSQRSPVVVDETFAPLQDRPIGPFVSSDGQEILPFRPGNLYVAGVLFPPDVEHPASAAAAEEEEQFGLQVEPEAAPKEQEDDGGQFEAQEEVAPTGNSVRGRSRSMAVSFRIPGDVESADLTIRFGSYLPISVAGQRQNWWQRSPHEIGIDIDVSQSHSQSLEVGGFVVRLSCRSRPTHNGHRICTISVSNETSADRVAVPEVARCMFQSSMEIRVAGLLPYAPERRNRESVDLLYRNIRHRAVGHGCDASVLDGGSGGFLIRTEAVPVVDVLAAVPSIYGRNGLELQISMLDLADSSLPAKPQIEELIALYDSWINDQSLEVERLSDDDRPLGLRQMSEWRKFLEDIRVGWQLILTNDEARECFCDANRAMHFQRIASSRGLRRAVVSESGEISFEGSSNHSGAVAEPTWRPFQIAFILSSLPKLIEVGHDDRRSVDVIWMPTGGGKTEAYLGLSAFAILWERLQGARARAQRSQQTTKVLMRYTLQLLTVQQLIRSASLICALEEIRSKKPERYGISEVRLGAWVGSGLTPNNRREAIRRLAQAEGKAPMSASGFLLSQCPWCGAQMGFVAKRSVAGYSRVKLPPPLREQRLLTHCPDPTCRFARRQEVIQGKARERGLPILETDEDLYDYPPDFVIGTVDKVATMAIAPDSQAIFGLKDGRRVASPPALFIQDELHLISGPLGSLDGVFELMLERLCLAGEGGRSPLYVAATATTRNFGPQIHGLYGRDARLVPPPGLDIADSFFSRQDPDRPTRRYLAVSSSGGLPAVEVQLRALATLAHFAGVMKSMGAEVDPYWTDVSFFSSRRVLGMLSSSVETKLRGVLDRIRLASGSSSGERIEGGQRPLRAHRRPKEITATGSENVSEVLADLGRPYDDPQVVDFCFATSMIEVGLDVPRLGLMTVMGQPKGSSQYIQVSGRVGRSDKAPALIIDVLNSSSPRDRSHYESFIGWHERLYASVESASVTPYTRQALERSCPTTIAALVQILETSNGGTITDQVKRIWPTLEEWYLGRAVRHGQWEHDTTKQILADMFAQASVPAVSGYAWRRGRGVPDFLEIASNADSASRANGVWRILTSMRSVDPDAPAQLISYGPPTSVVSTVIDVPNQSALTMGDGEL